MMSVCLSSSIGVCFYVCPCLNSLTWWIVSSVFESSVVRLFRFVVSSCIEQRVEPETPSHTDNRSPSPVAPPPLQHQTIIMMLTTATTTTLTTMTTVVGWWRQWWLLSQIDRQRNRETERRTDDDDDDDNHRLWR